MPFYVKGTDTIVRGTLETVQVTYPITHDGNGGWRYSGGGSEVFWDSAEPIPDGQNGATFLTEDGDNVREELVEWRDD